ncbi:MAG: hypothetical protein EBT30_05000 [Verrucomicrobia bacterium]|nr:hypothetical protein [Verrucomicrobiota bacterium]
MNPDFPISCRQAELLAKLEARARECPGLYPLTTAEDFRRVAVDHAGAGDEEVCRVLEGMWRRPDEAVQLNAQSLIGRGHGLADRKGEEERRGGTANEGNAQPILRHARAGTAV